MSLMNGGVACQAGGTSTRAGISVCAVVPVSSVCHVFIAVGVRVDYYSSDIAVKKCGQL